MEMYYIIDNKGRYYCYNDFNGKAAMLSPDNQGNPPSIALAMEKKQAERKMNHLLNHTNNNTNTPDNKRKGYYYNDFSSLHLVVLKTKGLSDVVSEIVKFKQ